MPMTRRIPKRGFNNPFRVESQVIGLDDLARVPAGTEITTESLREAGVISSKAPVKVLAHGDVASAGECLVPKPGDEREPMGARMLIGASA
jgi:large subunit ribosomal protein L15